MEQIEDKSSLTIPKFLVYSAMVLVIARLCLFAYSIHFDKGPSSKPQAVEWTDLTKLVTHKLNKNHNSLAQKHSSKPAPILCSNCSSIANQKTKTEEKKSFVLANHIDDLLGLERQHLKPIIYEFYAPNSDPCKRMENTSFSNSQVISLLKENFNPVRVTYASNNDPTLTKVLVDFRRKYRVCAFPTLVVVDANGKEFTNLVGNCSSLTTYKFLSRTIARLHSMGLYTQSGKSKQKVQLVSKQLKN